MLVQATLKAQLVANMTSASSEADGIAHFVAAYGNYAAGAVAAPSPLTPLGLAAGQAAMQPAMVGVSIAGAGAAKIVAGVTAFWVGVAAGLAASFAGAIAIVPPSMAGLPATLAAAFAANAAEGASLDAAMDRIAAAIHAQTIIGGVVTYPPSVASPIL